MRLSAEIWHILVNKVHKVNDANKDQDREPS